MSYVNNRDSQHHKKYADIMVSSQEVELGTGWHYHHVLSPFQSGSIEKRTFAEHIVNQYAAAYAKITNDYTLSAIDLSKIDDLESNIHEVSTLLLECLKHQTSNSVKNTSNYVAANPYVLILMSQAIKI